MSKIRDMHRERKQMRGCLIGGAIGDALGRPVEFLRYEAIKNRFGSDGITDLVISERGKAEITDDTQMTMFTAEGLLRAESRGSSKGICHVPTVVYFAYQRWLVTQGYAEKKDFDWIYDGWLFTIDALHVVRAPGHSCLSALVGSDKGTIKNPINNSKGCGAIMRSAPFGLFFEKEMAFQVAEKCAALTHGHPTGYLSAGALAYLIAEIIEGQALQVAVQDTIFKLETEKNSEECLDKLQLALELAETSISDEKAISRIGEGWIGEEALGIAVYCAIKYQNDFRRALIVAVNHNGDSDSTGAITGNILGAYLGFDAISTEWVKRVEFTDEIMQLSDDLLTRYLDNKEWEAKYPGY